MADITRQPRSEAAISEDFAGPLIDGYFSVRAPLAMAARKARLDKADPKYLSELEKLYTKSLENSQLLIKQGSISGDVATRVGGSSSNAVLGYKGQAARASADVAVANTTQANTNLRAMWAEAIDRANSAMIPAADQAAVEAAAGVAASTWGKIPNATFDQNVAAAISEVGKQSSALAAAGKNDLHSGAVINRLVQRVKDQAGYTRMSDAERDTFDRAVQEMYGNLNVTTERTEAGIVPSAVVKSVSAEDQTALADKARTVTGGIRVENPRATPTSAAPAAQQAPARTVPQGGSAAPAAPVQSAAAAPQTISAEEAQAQGGVPAETDAMTGAVMSWDLPGGGRYLDAAYHYTGQNPMVGRGLLAEEARRADLAAKIAAEQGRVDAARLSSDRESTTIGLPLRNVAPHPAQGAIDNYVANFKDTSPARRARFIDMIQAQTAQWEAEAETPAQARSEEAAKADAAKAREAHTGPDDQNGAASTGHIEGTMSQEKINSLSRALAKEHAEIEGLAKTESPESMAKLRADFQTKVAATINGMPAETRVEFTKGLGIPDAVRQGAMVEAVKRRAPDRVIEDALAEEDRATTTATGKALDQFREANKASMGGYDTPEGNPGRLGAATSRANDLLARRSPSNTGDALADANKALAESGLKDNTAPTQVAGVDAPAPRAKFPLLTKAPSGVGQRVSMPTGGKPTDQQLNLGDHDIDPDRDIKDAYRDAWHALNPDKAPGSPTEEREAWVQQQIDKSKKKGGADAAKP